MSKILLLLLIASLCRCAKNEQTLQQKSCFPLKLGEDVILKKTQGAKNMKEFQKRIESSQEFLNAYYIFNQELYYAQTIHKIYKDLYDVSMLKIIETTRKYLEEKVAREAESARSQDELVESMRIDCGTFLENQRKKSIFFYSKSFREFPDLGTNRVQGLKTEMIALYKDWYERRQECQEEFSTFMKELNKAENMKEFIKNIDHRVFPGVTSNECAQVIYLALYRSNMLTIIGTTRKYMEEKASREVQAALAKSTLSQNKSLENFLIDCATFLEKQRKKNSFLYSKSIYEFSNFDEDRVIDFIVEMVALYKNWYDIHKSAEFGANVEKAFQDLDVTMTMESNETATITIGKILPDDLEPKFSKLNDDEKMEFADYYSKVLQRFFRKTVRRAGRKDLEQYSDLLKVAPIGKGRRNLGFWSSIGCVLKGIVNAVAAVVLYAANAVNNAVGFLTGKTLTEWFGNDKNKKVLDSVPDSSVAVTKYEAFQYMLSDILGFFSSSFDAVFGQLPVHQYVLLTLSNGDDDEQYYVAQRAKDIQGLHLKGPFNTRSSAMKNSADDPISYDQYYSYSNVEHKFLDVDKSASGMTIGNVYHWMRDEEEGGYDLVKKNCQHFVKDFHRKFKHYKKEMCPQCATPRNVVLQGGLAVWKCTMCGKTNTLPEMEFYNIILYPAKIN